MNASGPTVRAAVLTALTSLAALATGCPPPPECDGAVTPACPSDDVIEDDSVVYPDAVDVTDAFDAADVLDVPDVIDARDAIDVPDVPIIPDVPDAADVPMDTIPQAACAPIESFGATERVIEGSVRGPTSLNYNRCAEATPGGEAVYRFEVPGSTPLGVLFSTAGSTMGGSAIPSALDTTLAIYRGCSVPTSHAAELACNDNAGSSAGSVVRAVLTPGVYSVAVDTVGSLALSGPFTLHARTFVPAANPRCTDEAPELTAGPAVTATVGTGGAYPSPPCRRREGGATVFYRINLAATATGLVTVTPTTAGWQPLVRVVTSCAAEAVCLADGVATVTGDGGAVAAPLAVTVPAAMGRATALWLAVSSRTEPVPDGATATVRLETNP